MTSTTSPDLGATPLGARPAAGTYTIDPGHSSVSFTGRHLMISKVRGRFAVTAGAIVIADDPAASGVEATVDAASVSSGDDKRDGHLRSPDFFDAERFPTITFRSTAVDDHGNGTFDLTGDLSVRGVTRTVTWAGEYLGASPSPFDPSLTVIGFTAEVEVNRRDWGLEWNMALEAGGVLVGEKVKLVIDAEAVKQ